MKDGHVEGIRSSCKRKWVSFFPSYFFHPTSHPPLHYRVSIQPNHRKRRTGLHRAAREYLTAYRECSEYTAKFSLLFLAISAVRQAERLPLTSDNLDGQEGMGRNVNDTLISQKRSPRSSLSSGEAVKSSFRSLSQGRVGVGYEILLDVKDFPTLIVPAATTSGNLSFSILNDMLLLEKKLENICNMEYFSHNLCYDDHEKSLRGFRGMRSINSTPVGSWYLFSVSSARHNAITYVASPSCLQHSFDSNYGLYIQQTLQEDEKMIAIKPAVHHQSVAKCEIIPQEISPLSINLKEDLSQFLSDSLTGITLYSKYTSETELKDPCFWPKNILRLLQIIKGLCEEKENLLIKNEVLKTVEERSFQVSRELMNFKEHYFTMFERLKVAFEELTGKYSNNPSTTSMSSEGKERYVVNTGIFMSESKRILQLEKMVSGLLDRIERGKVVVKQKKTEIEKYEAYFTKLKTSAKRQQVSQISSKIPLKGQVNSRNMLQSTAVDLTEVGKVGN